MTTAAKYPQTTEISAEKALHMFRQMVAIRLFEEQVNDLALRAPPPQSYVAYYGHCRAKLR